MARCGGSYKRRHKLQHRIKHKKTGEKTYRYSTLAKDTLLTLIESKSPKKRARLTKLLFNHPEDRAVRNERRRARHAKKKGKGSMAH